jgi:cysteinyl-tRNA synthetase
MLDVLGLNPYAAPWVSPDAGEDLRPVVERLVAEQIAAREKARSDKDFAAADAIRDRLAAAGIELTDNPTGTRWSIGSERP